MKLKVFLSPLISKIVIVKSKLSIIVKRIIPITLAVTLAFSSPAFAVTQVDQESLYPLLRAGRSGSIYWHDGTRNTISSNTAIGYLLATLAEASTDSLKYIYSSVDGVEGSLSTISGNINDISSVLSNISGYVDGLEGYVDGLESAFSTNNSRLQSILSAVQSITTYNYTSVLNSILANTNYLSSIKSHLEVTNSSLGSDNTNGIWGATYGTAYNTGLISSDTSSMLSLLNDKLSDATNDNIVIYRRYSPTNSPVALSTITANGLSVPYYLGNFSSPFNIGGYSYSFKASSGNAILDYLEVNNLHNIFLTSKIFTPYSQYRKYYLNENFGLQQDTSSDGSALGYLSIADMLWDYDRLYRPMIAKLQFALADDDTIAQKKANSSSTSQVLNDFTGAGSASASLDDFTTMKDAGSSVKTGLNTNVSASSVLGVFNNEDGFGWFSQATLNSLDSTGSSNRRLMAANSGNDTPLYDSKLDEIFSLMGVNK